MVLTGQVAGLANAGMSSRDRGRPKIGLVVDHPLRDADGMALVAHILAQRGIATALVPFYAQGFDLGSLDLNVLVLNYVRPANLRLIRDAQRRGIALAVLDTEGGLLANEGPTSPSGMSDFLRRSGLDRDLALYMFWGAELRDTIVAETALDETRAAVTGCPRFDLAHPPWAKVGQGSGHVLVNTNFPAVNSAQGFGGGIDEMAMAAAGFSPSGIEEFVAINRKTMDSFVEAVATIAAARPQTRFVLRPHPFESDSVYRRRFAETPNLEIRREGNVLDALAGSACLLHVNCTTSIEAVLCRVPPISLDYANQPQMRCLLPLPTEVSHRASGHTEALDLIDRASDLPPASPSVIDTIAATFGPIDGRGAERVAAHLAPFASAARRRSVRAPRANVDGRQRLIAAAGRMLGSRAIEALRQRRRPARRDKALCAHALRAALDRFAAAQGVAPARIERQVTTLGAPMLSFAVLPPDTPEAI